MKKQPATVRLDRDLYNKVARLIINQKQYKYRNFQHFVEVAVSELINKEK